MGRLWSRFAPYIIGTAVLIVVGTGGYRAWEAWEASRSETAGDAFLEALETSNAGKHDEARSALEALSGSTGGYPVLAAMRSAAELAVNGDNAGALVAFDAVAADGSIGQVYRDLANVRAAYLALDVEERTSVEARVSGLADAAHALRHSAREIMGLAAWKAGDMKAADIWFAAILDDNESPNDVVNRARMMQSLLAAAGATSSAQ